MSHGADLLLYQANRLRHVVYTIPVAILLSVVLFPLCTRQDAYKIGFLVTVAFTYTIPWYAEVNL